MGCESLTDEKINLILLSNKQIKNPQSKELDKGSHTQRNYKVTSLDGQEYTLYVRQSKLVNDDFSCGLLWHMPSGEVITLVRYNGSSHYHPNHLEETELDFACHIHRATERYIQAGKKPEGYAEETTRYSTINGALHCLTTDCKISGLKTEEDHPDLFK
jgi:hypothetical protein